MNRKINEDKILRIIPFSSSKPQPDFIPAPLRQDYEEACIIRDFSPKASATLSRRCLQGMIRDFCGISKATLHQEIQALRKQVGEGKSPAGVTNETIDAIEHVKSIGNIGAHMEKDINLIVDVDSNEAQLMVELIEMLFEDWYVARHQRQARFAQIKATAEAKQQAKKGSPAEPAATVSDQ